MDFIKLVIDSDRSGAKSVICKRETAAYFGWDKAFEEFEKSTRYRKDGTPYTQTGPRKDRTLYHGGTRLRICRVASKNGQPAKYTHYFRMLGNYSRKHLVQLAAVAGDKFEWMENTRFARVDRDVWLALDR